MNKIAQIVHNLRFVFSESYRIEIGAGLSPIRNKREMRALIKFCENALKDRKHMKLNPLRKEIFRSTVKMYRANEKGQYPVLIVNGTKYYSLFAMINDFCGWYWD